MVPQSPTRAASPSRLCSRAASAVSSPPSRGLAGLSCGSLSRGKPSAAAAAAREKAAISGARIIRWAGEPRPLVNDGIKLHLSDHSATGYRCVCFRNGKYYVRARLKRGAHLRVPKGGYATAVEAATEYGRMLLQQPLRVSEAAERPSQTRARKEAAKSAAEGGRDASALSLTPRLVWPGEPHVGFIAALLSKPGLAVELLSTPPEEAHKQEYLDGLPPEQHGAHLEVLLGMSEGSKDAGLRFSRMLGSLTAEQRESLEVRAATRPVSQDEITLRWLWTRCLLGDGSRAEDGRIGHCDARNVHGCGGTHMPPYRSGECSMSWFQDKKCLTWCAHRRCGACAPRLLSRFPDGTWPRCDACGESHEAELLRYVVPGCYRPLAPELMQTSAMLGVIV